MLRKGERLLERGVEVWNWCRCSGVVEAEAVVLDEAATAREEVFAELAASDLQSRRLAAGVATLMTGGLGGSVWCFQSRMQWQW